MVSIISHDVKFLIAIAAISTVSSCANSNQDTESKSPDLSILKGTWLAHDGDEQLNGELALRITQDSAYFGYRVFADGHSDFSCPGYLCRLGTVPHFTNDSLILSSKNHYREYSWRVASLDEKHLVLVGDSYAYEFIKQGNTKENRKNGNYFRSRKQ